QGVEVHSADTGEFHDAAGRSVTTAQPVVKAAFLILNEGFEPSEDLLRDIQRFMKENAAPYKYPREIEFVKELPKTQSGKIKRKLLREQELEKKKE
ncbi:MAG: AMP-binding enzyme, partial [Thermoplasmatota archaeon]